VEPPAQVIEPNNIPAEPEVDERVEWNESVVAGRVPSDPVFKAAETVWDLPFLVYGIAKTEIEEAMGLFRNTVSIGEVSEATQQRWKANNALLDLPYVDDMILAEMIGHRSLFDA
jgi:hypothetical protein